MSEKSELANPEACAYRFQIVCKPVRVQGCGIGNQGRASCSALVVKEKYVSRRQRLQIRRDVAHAESRTAVKHDNRIAACTNDSVVELYSRLGIHKSLSRRHMIQRQAALAAAEKHEQQQQCEHQSFRCASTIDTSICRSEMSVQYFLSSASR